MITPIIGLETWKHRGDVGFILSKTGKTVRLQWEPFTCRLAANGVSYISVAQGVPHLPCYPLSFPIKIQYKGIWSISTVDIYPDEAAQIRFVLNVSGSGVCTSVGDEVAVAASSVGWIVE